MTQRLTREGFEVDARAKQHARAPSRTRPLRASAYTCIRARACVEYARVRTYARLRPDRGEERKKGEGKREIYLPEFRWPPPRRFRRMHLAFGIFREIYVLRRIPSERFPSSVRSLLFHRRVRSRRAMGLQRPLRSRDEVKGTSNYFQDFRGLHSNIFTRSRDAH